MGGIALARLPRIGAQIFSPEKILQWLTRISSHTTNHLKIAVSQNIFTQPQNFFRR